MTLQDKLSAQSGREDKIHLFKEGKFWKAYESSAFLFIRYVKAYKVLNKMIKYLGMPVASLGFPEESFDNVVGSDFDVIEIDDRYRIVSSDSFLFSMSEFTLWKDELPLMDDVVHSHPQVSVPSPLSCGVSVSVSSLPAAIQDVLDQIKSFGIESKTPIECMIFLTQIQKKLYGTI